MSQPEITSVDIQKMIDDLAEWAASMFQALRPAIEQISTVIQDAYHEAGQPYGDNHEGIIRWLDEIGAIGRLRQEADRIEQYHKMIADFRRRMHYFKDARGEG